MIPIQSEVVTITMLLSAYSYAKQAYKVYGVLQEVLAAQEVKDQKTEKFLEDIKKISEQTSQAVDKVSILLRLMSNYFLELTALKVHLCI